MKKTTIAFLLAAAPLAASADVENLRDLIRVAVDTINLMVPLMFGLALVGFMWSIIKYLYAGGNPEKLKEARNYIIFSIVAIAVMMSVWSLALLVKEQLFPDPYPIIGGPGYGD